MEFSGQQVDLDSKKIYDIMRVFMEEMELRFSRLMIVEGRTLDRRMTMTFNNR